MFHSLFISLTKYKLTYMPYSVVSLIPGPCFFPSWPHGVFTSTVSHHNNFMPSYSIYVSIHKPFLPDNLLGTSFSFFHNCFFVVPFIFAVFISMYLFFFLNQNFFSVLSARFLYCFLVFYNHCCRYRLSGKRSDWRLKVTELFL